MKAMIKIKRHDGHDMAVGLAEDMALPKMPPGMYAIFTRDRADLFRHQKRLLFLLKFAGRGETFFEKTHHLPAMAVGGAFVIVDSKQRGVVMLHIQRETRRAHREISRVGGITLGDECLYPPPPAFYPVPFVYNL